MKLRIIIDRDRCIACGTCTIICPEVFELGVDIGKSKVKDEYTAEISEKESVGYVSKELSECVKSAEQSCPVSAIRVEEAM